MHGKLDLSKTKGLKKSELKKLQGMLQEKIPENKILTASLAEEMAEFSYESGLPISAVINRRGQVVSITVGQLRCVDTSELKGLRSSNKLSGQRLIYTKTSASNNGPSKEDLQFLVSNRLDMLVQVKIDPEGQFSRAHGEQGNLADVIYLAHLLPTRTDNGQLWKILPPCTVRQAEEEEFDRLIDALEDEFKRNVNSNVRSATGTVNCSGITKERAILVGLIQEGQDAWQIEDDLDELTQLAKACSAEVCGRLSQARLQPDPRTFLGSGKVQELALMIEELGANLVIVNSELSGNQKINLEQVLNVKVLDRTELILNIFAQRAHTKEGKLQVELAQLKYLYPRLIGKGHELSRLGGGIGTRGPGETKLEVDRRRIRNRINLLENQTHRIRSYRDTQRRQRITQKFPVVALTGYTNSGKSTLLNALTKSETLVEDKLFATLDPATRKTVLPDLSPVLITDTVGFIKKLPTSLMAAFGATLEEVVVADILVHVVDASHPNVLEQISSVHDVLSELQAVDKPMITALNKADKVRQEDLAWLANQLPNPVILSAKERQGLGSLMEKIQDVLQEVYSKRYDITA